MKVEARLAALLPPEDERPERLHQAMRYSVLGGGKRFRPLLCLAASEAVGGATESVLDAACALEFIHCFSLIHDDLPALDNDDLRRGKPSCHVAFGESTALLAGDALFALAFATLAGMEASDTIRRKATSALAAASGTHGMVGGQTVDIEAESTGTDIETVLWIHKRKTGALIAASCEIGAITAGGTREEICACKRCGEGIGLAFQIRDDILNEVGDQALMGKRTRTDRSRKKATFPAVAGVEESRRMAEEAYRGAVCDAARFGERGEGLKLLAEFAANRTS